MKREIWTVSGRRGTASDMTPLWAMEKYGRIYGRRGNLCLVMGYELDTGLAVYDGCQSKCGTYKELLEYVKKGVKDESNII